MKKINSIFKTTLLFCLCAFTTIHAWGQAEENPLQSTLEANFTAAGGSVTRLITDKQGVTFRIESSAGHWCTGEKKSDTEITITALKNTSAEKRSGSISVEILEGQKVVDSKKIPVSQEAFSFSVDPGALAFPSEGSQKPVKITTTAGWKIVKIPEWVTVSEKEGKGIRSINITAKNNPTIFSREGSVLIENTDTKDQIALNINQPNSSQFDGFTGYEKIGYGYYIPGGYADQKQIREEVLDFNKLKNLNLITVAKNEKTNNINYIEENFESLCKSVSNNISGGGGGTQGVKLSKDSTGVANSVNVSLKHSYEKQNKSITGHKYALMREEIKKYSVKVPLSVTTEQLRELLSESADKNINGTMKPQDIIKHYGTHVVLGYVLGGTFDYYMSVNENSVTSSEEWGFVVDAAATYKQGSGKVNDEFKKYQSLQKDKKNFFEKLTANGGESQFVSMDKDGKQRAYEKWQESFSDSKNWIIIDFDAPGIIGVWDLAKDAKRRSELEKAIKDEIESQKLLSKTAVISVTQIYKLVKRNDAKNSLTMSVREIEKGYPASEEIVIMDYNKNLNFKSGSFKPSYQISKNIHLDLRDNHKLVFKGNVNNPAYTVMGIGYQDFKSTIEAELSYDAKTKKWTYDGKEYKPGEEFIVNSKNGKDIGVEIHMKLTY